VRVVVEGTREEYIYIYYNFAHPLKGYSKRFENTWADLEGKWNFDKRSGIIPHFKVTRREP